jgi:hypothetical protein
MLTLIARIGWGLSLLGIAAILYVAAWFAHFALILRPFGVIPFSWSFIQANPIWGVELLVGLCSTCLGIVIIAVARRWTNSQLRRRAIDTF